MLLAVGLLANLTAAAPSAGADLFDDLYQRGQTLNGDLRTFTAAFSETTSSALLTKPLVARGTVAVERPGRVALHYSDPDRRLVLIDNERMILSWPARDISQSRDIGAAQARVRKYFVDSSARELRSHFDIQAEEAADRKAYRITMVPRRKQIKEGLARLVLTIDEKTLLLSAMTMAFPNGDTKEMSFTDVTTNAVLDPALFKAAR